MIRFGRLGDTVMLSALLHLLHLRFHRPCVVIGAGAWNTALFADHPDVARAWSFPRHFPIELTLTWWRAVWALRRTAPGPVYICEYMPKQLARIRRLLAFSGVAPERCVFITEERPDADDHWIDRQLRLGERTPPALRAADYPLPPPGAGGSAPRLRVSDAERAALDAWLAGQGWAARPLVLVQPGNYRSMRRRRDAAAVDMDSKAWPAERWVSLLHQVHAAVPDALLLLCGAPQEGRMLQELAAEAAMPQVKVAELPLRRLLALCELAHSMISVDTGPAHAAAALGVPLVVMYGAELPRQWLPRSPCGSPVVAVGGPPRSGRVDQIAVDEVFSAWRDMLATLPPQRTSRGACEVRHKSESSTR